MVRGRGVLREVPGVRRAPRVPGLLVVALLLAVTSTVVTTDAAPDDAAGPGTWTTAASSTRCRGLSHDDVRGADPTYTRKRLARFTNADRLCRGIWLPGPRRYFVPQGLAISGHTAWISGFRYREGYGQRPCQLVRVDLVTGRRLDQRSAIYGRVGSRPRTYCRHGGGMVQSGGSLWVVEKNKLWLVRPSDSRGGSVEARRVWRIHAPVRGSAIVATRSRVGLVPYQKTGKPHIFWYSVRALKRRGVLDLAARSAGRHQLGASSYTRVPRFVQGATLGRTGRLYLVRSNLSCAELVTSTGRRLGVVPGAEGLQFTAGGRRLWVVSESGAWPYAATSRKPLTPAVSSFGWKRLARGRPATCGFPRY